MKLEKVRIENENGETADIVRADYIKQVVKEQEVKAFESEETGSTPADKVVTHILKSLEGGTEIDPSIQGEYSELIKVIEADYNRTVNSKADKKKEAEEAKAKKEAEKKAREEEEAKKKAELALTQQAFVEKVAAGADLAAQEFASELKALGESLPEGVTIVQHGAGFGIEFSSEATKETIGQTLGYTLQKADNSSFIGNQLHFWVGDIIGVAVARGFFDTAKEAAQYIAKLLSEKQGKTIEAPSLDQYKRMAERTPVEFRNPKADPTAYLAISAMKEPKKGEKETDDQFKARKAKFDEDRADVQKKLAIGEISKRKEVMPIVNGLLVKHGMKTAVDPDAPQISVSQQLQIFFHTTFALESLLGTHKEDMVIYKEGSDLIEVSKEDMEEKRAVALGHLVNMLYTNEKLGIKPEDFTKGYVMKKAKVEVAKDAEGKAIMEEQNVKNLIYPAPFFTVEKAEAPAEAPAEAAPAEAAPTKGGKKGK